MGLLSPVEELTMYMEQLMAAGWNYGIPPRLSEIALFQEIART